MHSLIEHRSAPVIALHPLAEWLASVRGRREQVCEEAHSAWKRKSRRLEELPEQESQPQSSPGEERDSTGERERERQ